MYPKGARIDTYRADRSRATRKETGNGVLKLSKPSHRISRLAMLAVVALSGFLLAGCATTAKGDPAGTATGGAADVVNIVDGGPAYVDKNGKPTTDLTLAANDKDGNPVTDIAANAAKEPLAAELAAVGGQNRVAINFVWTLVAGFLVMFMQAGFAIVETGFTRAKSAAHTMSMNFMVYGLGMLGFWIAGFAFMFGGIGSLPTLGGGAPLSAEWTVTLFDKPFGLLRTTGFFLAGNTYDVSIAVMFLFQMVFMDTAATIPTGAMAERWKFSAFCVFGFFCSTLTYPVFGNWAWGGGWLAQLGSNFGLGHGYADFAGSGVVHSVGAWMGLAGAMILGPRIGKYNKDGSANAIPGHDLTIAMLGTFILAFGWFGFNPGSTLGASGNGALRIGLIAVDTMLAGAAASLSAMLFTWWRSGKPDPGMLVNGLLVGLVAITPPSGFGSPITAVIIGLIAGVIVCFGLKFFGNIHIDDPVRAISVHGLGGVWGVLAVGLFADGTSNYGGALEGVTRRGARPFFRGPGQDRAPGIAFLSRPVSVFVLSLPLFIIPRPTHWVRRAPPA